MKNQLNSDCVIISVVRDRAMYDRLVLNNPCNRQSQFVMFDNNEENLTIPRRYNSFLESYDYSVPSWFVFCHEDFECLEPLASHLPTLAQDCIYGVCGQSLQRGNLGYQLNSNKDGSQLEFRGKPIKGETKVDTLDCCFLMVHSTLAQRKMLRFDERLTWDLYTEDFCISANVNHNIETRVFPIRSYHHSYGNVQPRFLDQLAYLREKYKSSNRVYATTTAYSIGGEPSRLSLIDKRLRHQQRSFLRHLFYRKYSHTGRLLVKILGIPVVRRQAYRIDDWLGGKR